MNQIEKTVVKMLKENKKYSEIMKAVSRSKATISYYARKHSLSRARLLITDFDWKSIQTFYDEGNSARKTAAHFEIAQQSLFKASRKGLFITRSRLSIDDSKTKEEIVSRQRQNKRHIYAPIREQAKRTIMKGREKICENCYWNHHIHVCHRRPIADFPMSATMKEINNPDNLVLLCPNCHWLLDNDLI